MNTQLKTKTIDRKKAALQAAKLGFPNAKFEPWRYSRIAAYQDRDWGMSGVSSKGGSVEALVLDEDEQNAFIQLNWANADLGYCLEHSGEQLFHYDKQHQRNVIKLGVGEKAVVVEDLRTTENSVGTSLTEIDLAEGAELIRVQLRRHGEGSAHVGHTAAHIGGHATFTNIDFNIGGGLARNEIQVKLLQPQAKVNLYGTYLLEEKQHSDTITYVEHAAPETFSKEVYKGVVNDEARGIFQGKIRVDPDAQRIQGHQLSRGLMLSDRSRIDVKPELEIFADDVICSHGATIGDLDPLQLFYLCSRGVPQNTARALLVQAFVAEIINFMPDQVDQDALVTEVEAWLVK